MKIYVLLYQEVEMAKQGNDSNRCKNILELLCPSMIFVIRHPNKLMGGSTALLWSHHEKIVVVDRTAAFIGGIDLAFGRYDDGEHLLVDEDGWRFPGGDYYQPGEGRFNPVPPPAALQSVTQRAGSMSSVRAEDVVAEYMNDTSTAESAVVISVTPFEALGPFSRASPSSSLPEDIAFPISDIQCPNDIDETESVSDLGDDYQQPLQAEEIRALQEAEEERGDLGGELYLNQTFALDELPVASVVYAAVLPEAERETIASTIASGRDKDDKLIEKKKNVWNFDSIVDAISGFSDAVVKSTGKGAAGESVAQLRPRRGVMRDMFPRMPWHDIQAYVGGLAARDISSHFIQRWNHHRLSKGSNKAHVFTEITDNPHFGVCARCLAAELSQDCKLCPRCNHDLGPRGCYFEFDALDKQGQLALRVPGRAIHPFIVFRCVFESKLGCRIQGLSISVYF